MTSSDAKRLAEVALRPGGFDDADAMATLFARSRKLAMPWLPVLHSPSEDRAYFARTVLRQRDVVVAERGGKVVGFAAFARGRLDHLYVHPDHQRQGVGGLLFRRVCQRLGGGFEFWVFQRNEAARTFYERHGCRLVRTTDGRDNEEREPDALYAWRPT